MPVVIAPWLRAADPVGSASAGANIGLAARARDLQEAAQQQAADEFIARLNQQAQQFDRNLVSEQDIARQRLAQALRQQDALDIYHKGELEVRKKEAETHAARLLKDNLEPEFRPVEGGRAFRRGENSWQFVPDKAEKELTRTPAQWNALIKDLREEVPGESPEAKANRLQKLGVAVAAREKLMLPNMPPLVPQVVPTPDNRSMWEKRPELLGGVPAPAPTTNWVQQLTGTNAPAVGVTNAPVVEERVIVVKDGKRYRLPRNELEEAEKSGYRLER